MITVPAAALAQLAKAYGAQASDLKFISGGREESDGVLYVFQSKLQKRLLKIMALPVEQQQDGLFRLEARLRFARFVGEHGVRMVYPQLSEQSRLYETCLEGAHLWVAYSMEVAAGHVPQTEDLTPSFCSNWGQIVGKLHRLAQHYPNWQTALNPATGLTTLTWQEEWQDFYDWSKDLQVRGKWVELRSRLEALPIERSGFGFVHNDPHQWNLLADSDQITLLDFDVANHHWFINDIAIACQSVLFDQSGGMHQPVHDRYRLITFLRSFLAGYRSEYELDAAWLRHLDLFFAYRRILLFTVMQGWIQSQPDMHARWKQMILDEPEVLGEAASELLAA